MAGTELVSARRSFVAVVAGTTHRVRSGHIYAASDPLVKAQPDKFGPLDVRSTRKAPAPVSTPAPAPSAAQRGPGGHFLRRSNTGTGG